MTQANGPERPPSPSDKPDTAGETMRERLQRMRAGTEEPPPEREEPAARAPRIARKEPGRRVREQKRTAEVREPRPPAAERGRPTARKPAPPAEPGPPEAVRPPEPGPPEAVRPPEPGPPEAVRRRSTARKPEPTTEPGPPEAVRPPEGGPAEGDGGAQAEVVSERLAARLAALRSERGWSLQDLARRTGVSRSNLSRIERGEISPTADVLVRLAAAYDQTLSALMAEVESQPRSLVRAAEQAVTGEDTWRRRVVSPPYPGLAGSITDAQLLPGGDVTYDPPLPGAEQHLWLITGSLEVTLVSESPSGSASASGESSDDDPEVRAEKEGDFVLIRGDCLRLRLWGPARLRCLSPEPARYALFTVTPTPSP